MPQDTDLFLPMRQLLEDHEGNRPDRDLWLFYLTAPGVVYHHQVDDPWFSAHTPTNFSNILIGPLHGASFFVRDEPAGVIDCTSQVQYCNPNLPEDSRCEPLSSYGTSFYNNIVNAVPTTGRFSMS